ncbi:MAG: phosphotransferase [Firmicutes bacterium]|nr:phosphotransferase [Bacillota bacterium]
MDSKENKNLPPIEVVREKLEEYGYTSNAGMMLVDTSHGDDDIRLNYIIEKKWVMRFTNAPEMTENRLAELNRLIDRYIDFGLKCPRFIKDKNGIFLHEWNGMTCYLQEYINLSTAYGRLNPEQMEEVWLEILDSVAGFAEKYRNVDLSETFGMYSLFDLAPYDIALGIDEKQQNFNALCQALRGMGEGELVERLEQKHSEVRELIKSVHYELPRCVFQGDENLSNVLIDENRHMVGMIDFNMAGTEVIVNQFANLGGGFKEEVREPIGAQARLDYAIESYREYQERMLNIYHATDLEKKAIKWYEWIALVSGWPQVCFFIDGLKTEKLKNEILGLLGLLADYQLPE